MALSCSGVTQMSAISKMLIISIGLISNSLACCLADMQTGQSAGMPPCDKPLTLMICMSHDSCLRPGCLPPMDCCTPETWPEKWMHGSHFFISLLGLGGRQLTTVSRDPVNLLCCWHDIGFDINSQVRCCSS